MYSHSANKLGWKKLAQRIRVPAGTILGVIFLLLMRPSLHSLLIGSAIAIVGALLRLWAAGHIEKGRALTRSGPYSFTRNPLYLGSFLMALGIITAGQRYWLLFVFGIFFTAFYIPVMKAEERELLLGFGDDFIEYSKQVPLFFPNFWNARLVSSPFMWSRVIRNREHHTVAGFLATEAILILQSFFQR
jgi:protein-S-isoprenylcysteine O-methyltransferase Ste14